MVLVRRVLALDGKNIFMQKMSAFDGISNPTRRFLFLPNAVEPEGCVVRSSGNAWRKFFAHQHAANLTSSGIS